jgi:glycosyltransferase involved in cell wall biosynthesis
MKVLVDDGLASTYLSGIGMHTTGLLPALERLGSSEVDDFNVHKFNLNFAQRFAHKIKRGIYLLYLNFLMPILPKMKGFDLIHFSNHLTPIWGRSFANYVVTIQDLSALDIPDLIPQPAWYLKYAKFMLKRATKVCRVVVVPSEFTAKRVHELFKVPLDRIHVCYNGIQLGVQEEAAPVARTNEVLFVGCMERRKNPMTLIKAFEIAASQNPDIKLKFIGKTGFGYQDLIDEIDKSKFKDRIQICGKVPVDELARSYQTARMLVLPSFYEGFGIPVAEAMANGLPVVISDIDVLKEVTGKAGNVYGEPLDEQGLAKSILKLAEDDTCFKESSEAGKERALAFSWHNVAKQHYNAYLAAFKK